MAGVKKDRTPAECPYCGGNCHRKALQRLKGEPKPYRRMMCADGCGHFHYRNPDTDEVVQVGRGPRVPEWARKQTEPLPAFLTPIVPAQSNGGITLETIAADLGIVSAELTFTSFRPNGRPRISLDGWSTEEIEKSPEGATIGRVQQDLLTAITILKTYRDRVVGSKEPESVAAE